MNALFDIQTSGDVLKIPPHFSANSLVTGIRFVTDDMIIRSEYDNVWIYRDRVFFND